MTWVTSGLREDEAILQTTEPVTNVSGAHAEDPLLQLSFSLVPRKLAARLESCKEVTL